MSIPENFLWVDKFIWSGLVALGIQFLYMGYRLRSERVFAYFGASLLLLAMVFIGQVNPIPYIASLGGKVAWAYFSILMILVFLPAYLHFVFEVTEILKPRSFRVFCIVDAGLAGFLIWDFFSDRKSVWLRLEANLTFALPLLILLHALIIYFHAIAAQSSLSRIPLKFKHKATGLIFEKQLYRWLAIAGYFLALGGLVDMLAIFNEWPKINIAIKTAGLFTASGAYFLMHRFYILQSANSAILERLNVAYENLGNSNKMEILGISASSITHEIRNFAAILKGNSVLMGSEKADEGYKQDLERISATAERMEQIAKDVAVYANISTSNAKVELALDDLFSQCVVKWFSRDRERIHIKTLPFKYLIQGDKYGLEDVFVNFLRNSFEAKAKKIDIRFHIFGKKVIAVIEDDGIGCQAEDLDQITKPFFSKRSIKGTGLGCSIAESILKSHEASLRYYSKNVLGNGTAGMVLNMVFSHSMETDKNGLSAFPLPRELPIIMSGIQPPISLVQPMIHLGIRPVMMQIQDGLLLQPNIGDGSKVFADEQCADQWQKKSLRIDTIVVAANRTAKRFPSNIDLPQRSFLFSEEFIALMLVR
jgi:signal transduction histidine kinase